MKNEYYKQSVTVFGIVIPLVLMLVVGLAALYMSSSTATEYKKKKVVYDQAQTEMKATVALQTQLQEKGKYIEEWDKMLKTETRGSFLEHWKTAEAKFSGKELTKTSHNWLNYSEGLGKGINQPASQVNMSFSATYRAMQLALMEMETKLPQMQLDSMTITPSSNGESLDFKTKFTVWTLK